MCKYFYYAHLYPFLPMPILTVLLLWGGVGRQTEWKQNCYIYVIYLIPEVRFWAFSYFSLYKWHDMNNTALRSFADNTGLLERVKLLNVAYLLQNDPNRAITNCINWSTKTTCSFEFKINLSGGYYSTQRT